MFNYNGKKISLIQLLFLNMKSDKLMTLQRELCNPSIITVRDESRLLF